VAVLCHDPRLDMFRFMNVEDYGINLDIVRYRSSSITCRKKTAD